MKIASVIKDGTMTNMTSSGNMVINLTKAKGISFGIKMLQAFSTVLYVGFSFNSSPICALKMKCT